MTWNLIDSFSSNYEASISRSHHNRTFKANGRYWLFYGDVDTGLFGFVSSVDGETWASFTSLGSISPDNIDVFYDSANNKICYAYLGDPMYYRQGTANSDGTITWDSAEVSVGEVGYTAISLVKDSAGYPWIAFGTNVRIIKATATNGSTWGASIELWAEGSIPKIIPLTNGKLLCIKLLGLTIPKSRLYDGVDTWAASVDFAIAISDSADMFDAVAISDDVYFAMQMNPGYLYFYKYTYGVGWGSQEIVADVCKPYVNTCKICKIDADHIRVLYAVDFWKIYSRDRASGSWETPVILSKIDDGWENQCPSDCTSEWYMILQNGRGKLYWALAARPTPDTPIALVGKLFALGSQSIFRISQTTLVEEKAFDATSIADYMYKTTYDGTYLWIVELYTGKVFQIDPTGDMSLVQIYNLDNLDGYYDVYSIIESGDYLYLSVYEIDDQEYRFIRITKSDGTVSVLVPPDIGLDSCSTGCCIGADTSYVYFCGRVDPLNKQAVWKVNKSSFTVEDSTSYSSHPSRYYEDYQDPTYYYGENPSDHIVIDHHNYLAFKGYMNEILYWNRYARNTNPQPNFTYKFKTSIQGTSGGTGVDLFAFVWAYSNVSTDMKSIHDDVAHTSCALALQAGKDESEALYFKLREEYGDGDTTTTYFSDSFVPTIQVDYYVKIVKTSVEEVVTLTAYFYSDPGFSVLVDSISLTLHTSSVYPGFTIYYTCNVWNDSSTTGYLDLWVENSDLSGATEDPDLPEIPISSREIMILYVDSTYIYAVTAGGMVLKILKSDLSLSAEAEIIPGMGPCFNWEYSHEPVGKVFFESTSGDIYWTTRCISKHVVMKIRCGVWGIEKLCIDPADTYLARSSDGMGAYFYFATDTSTVKKVDISTMTIDSSLVLSVGIGVVYDLCCSPFEPE